MNKQIEDEGLTCAYLLGKSEGYQQGKADAIEELSSIVLKELKENAKDEDYFFDNDNLSLVSTVILTNAEKLKEQKGK